LPAPCCNEVVEKGLARELDLHTHLERRPNILPLVVEDQEDQEEEEEEEEL